LGGRNLVAESELRAAMRLYDPLVTHPDRIGRYRVLGYLGRGAMGVVYRGRDDALERDVALKVMSIGLGADSDARGRFQREAKAAARLQHPNIVTVYELGEHQGAPFIAMELLEGMDLQRAIEAGIRPDPALTFPILLQVLAGLGHAHEKGIVHRDVKPSNIFLPRGLPAKIMDFGVARLSGSTTTSGAVSGTPTYMSPEQVRGGLLDGRSDLFSTGLILYELVTGERAYRAESVVAVLYKIAHEDPDLALLPRGPEWASLREVISRSLARDPEDRYPDARAMASELALALRELGGEVDWAAPSDVGLLIRSTPRPAPVVPVEHSTADLQVPPGSFPPRPFPPEPVAAPPSSRWPRHAVAATVAAGLAVGTAAAFLYLFVRRGPSLPTPSPTPSPSASPSVPVSPTPSPSRADASPTPRPTPSPSPSSGPSSPTPSPTPSPTLPIETPTPRPSETPPSPTPSPIETAVPPAEASLDHAEALMQRGRFKEALAEAKAVLAREPGNQQAQTLVEDAEVEVVVEERIKEATDALRRGDKDAALEAIMKGLAAKKNDRRLLELHREAIR
jgi:serine/threonine-protein kinase